MTARTPKAAKHVGIFTKQGKMLATGRTVRHAWRAAWINYGQHTSDEWIAWAKSVGCCAAPVTVAREKDEAS